MTTVDTVKLLIAPQKQNYNGSTNICYGITKAELLTDTVILPKVTYYFMFTSSVTQNRYRISFSMG